MITKVIKTFEMKIQNCLYRTNLHQEIATANAGISTCHSFGPHRHNVTIHGNHMAPGWLFAPTHYRKMAIVFCWIISNHHINTLWIQTHVSHACIHIDIYILLHDIPMWSHRRIRKQLRTTLIVVEFQVRMSNYIKYCTKTFDKAILGAGTFDAGQHVSWLD